MCPSTPPTASGSSPQAATPSATATRPRAASATPSPTPGTTLLYLPTAVVTAYYKQVSGAKLDNSQGGYVYNCNTALPNFSVVIGGRTFVVPGSDITYAPTSGSQCFGGIQANTGIGFTIFGDIFLKSAFVVFDESQSTPRLGFAEK